MNKITTPLSPAQGLLVGLWDTAFAVRVLERDHGEDCSCAVCTEADRIGYLLRVTTQLLEDALDPGNGTDNYLTAHYWEMTRGRPIGCASIDATPNPAASLPRFPAGAPCPPIGTAAKWDRQFVSAIHRLMAGLYKVQHVHDLLEADGNADDHFAWHAGHINGLLTPIIDELDAHAIGQTIGCSEDWGADSGYSVPDPEIGWEPDPASLDQVVLRQQAEADKPVHVEVSALDLIETELAATAQPPQDLQPPGGYLWAVVSMPARGQTARARDWFPTAADAVNAMPTYQRKEPTVTFYVQCWPALAAARCADAPWEHFAEAC